MKRFTMLLSALLCLSVYAQNGRLAGLFYFLWLGEHGRRGPWDVSKILADDPDAGQKPEATTSPTTNGSCAAT